MKPVNFAAALRQHLERRGWSQYRLSKTVEIPEGTVSRWLSGQRKPNFVDVCRVADALGVSVDELRDVTNKG